MLGRTHIAFNFLLGFLILKFLENKILFLFCVFIFTFIPDLDSRFSKIGKRKIFRFIQYFAGHRKIFHSFIFLFLLLIPFYFISLEIFFGILLGYGGHLFLDCFTIKGIQPFYPFEYKIKGIIRTGSFFEKIIFYLILFVDFWIILNFNLH